MEVTQSKAGIDTPELLEVRLYEGLVPLEYETEFFALNGMGGIWSVSISAHDLKETNYYIAVLGKAELARYRITALLIASKFKMNHKLHAEVCEGQWLYFTYTPSLNKTDGNDGHRRLAHANEGLHSRPEMSEFQRVHRSILSSAGTDGHGDDCGHTTHGCNAFHISIHIWRYSGSFFLQPTDGNAPIKLVPPFKYLGEQDTDAVINLCNVDASASTHFLGVLGSSGCALFDIVAHKYVGGNCSEPRNFAEVDATEGAQELALGHYSYGSCTPGGYTGNKRRAVAFQSQV